MNLEPENGFRPTLAGSCPIHSRSPLLIGPRCELPRSVDGMRRRARVTASLMPPHVLRPLLPTPRGHQRESEPDYFRDDGRCIKKTTSEYVPCYDGDPMPVKYLQRVPAELLPRCVFLTEEEAKGGEE